jgi:predicted O-methyltransferase YrrM
MTYRVDICGWMPEEDLKILSQWASEVPPNSIMVEIGSFLGRSSYTLAASTTPGTRLACFDRWTGWAAENPFTDEERALWGYPIGGTPNSMDAFMKNVSTLSNICPYRVSCAADIQWKYGLVDFVFIDASHKNPSDWEYIEFWLPLIKPGGHLCGHDFWPDGNQLQFPDVNENVGRLTKILGKEPLKFLHSSLWRFQI